MKGANLQIRSRYVARTGDEGFQSSSILGARAGVTPRRAPNPFTRCYRASELPRIVREPAARLEAPDGPPE